MKMFENKNEQPDYGVNLISYQEAEEFTGAMWRRPTESELDEVAQFYAEDYIKGEIEHFGEELEGTDYLIAVNKEKQKILGEIRALGMVMDMVAIDAQIFYTYCFSVGTGTISKEITVEDGLCKLLKSKGTFRDISREDSFLL
jgi:hypothetical protein